MKKMFFALMACVGFVAAAAVHVSPANENIQYSGRVNFSNPERPYFVYPGVQIAVNFEGTGLAMEAKPGSGYFVVAVDNLPVRKIYFSPSDSVITLASGLPTEEAHTARVYLCYEGYAKKPEFRGFLLEGDTRLVAPPKRPKHRIEFIGNSITCGYGNESLNKRCPFADSTENHYLTYASLLCRMLDAEEHCTARSGIGVYRNYNGKREGDADTMSDWYDYTCLYDSTQRWDHSRFRPEVICVNLGTNDLSTKNHDIALYKKAYRKFILHLHEVQPQAKIVMLTGSMLFGAFLKEQIKALDELQDEFSAQGIATYRFDMSTQDGTFGYGGSWHPSARQHEIMAGQLLPLLSRLLNE
ncbi:MAG: SGNH/GDSL hydrolase family protein [Bacteroidales bacterium]|nr:SGNH/GDSL hydrolase family protein [Bacteroidales bacterium]